MNNTVSLGSQRETQIFFFEKVEIHIALWKKNKWFWYTFVRVFTGIVIASISHCNVL